MHFFFFFFALIQMTNESVLKDADGIYDEFATPEKAAEAVKLKVRSLRHSPCVPSYSSPPVLQFGDVSNCAPREM